MMKATEKNAIVTLINHFQLDEAEKRLKEIGQNDADDDEAYYLLGNISRKRNHWHEAMQWYARAIEKNPESPALHAREMIVQIMDFYDKERYNV